MMAPVDQVIAESLDERRFSGAGNAGNTDADSVSRTRQQRADDFLRAPLVIRTG